MRLEIGVGWGWPGCSSTIIQSTGTAPGRKPGTLCASWSRSAHSRPARFGMRSLVYEWMALLQGCSPSGAHQPLIVEGKRSIVRFNTESAYHQLSKTVFTMEIAPESRYEPNYTLQLVRIKKFLGINEGRKEYGPAAECKRRHWPNSHERKLSQITSWCALRVSK